MKKVKVSLAYSQQNTEDAKDCEGIWEHVIEELEEVGQLLPSERKLSKIPACSYMERETCKALTWRPKEIAK